jgi:cysteine desulfurase
MSLNVDRLGVDLLSLSGHKFGGPKGTGLLYLRRDVPFLEQLSGGGQERQRRSGTENTPGIVGISEALVLAQSEREAFAAHTAVLRDRLLRGVEATLPDVRVNGHSREHLPNNLHFCIPGVEGESVVEALDALGVACSAGAACTSATWEPSHVLLAMDVPLELAIGSVRMTVWPSLDEADVDYVVEQLPGVVARLRAEAAPIR